MIKKTLKINGVERILILDKDETLVQVLRDHPVSYTHLDVYKRQASVRSGF